MERREKIYPIERDAVRKADDDGLHQNIKAEHRYQARLAGATN